MVVAERTYSFRASHELGDRMREAATLLDEILSSAGAPKSEAIDRVARELVLAMMRDAPRFHEAAGNQSAFMRDTIELLVSVTEKLARDHAYAAEYAAEAKALSEDEREFRRGARHAAARSWT